MKSLISLAGKIGSGKSAVSEVLERKTGFEMISTGAMQRQIASEYGMTPLELNEYSKTNKEVDDKLDGLLISLNESDSSFIIDSRMAWHFVHSSFKVFLLVDPSVAAQRVAGAGREEEKIVSIAHAMEANLIRQSLENERFKSLYDVDCQYLPNYDLVVDTSDTSPEVVGELIYSEFQKWSKGSYELKISLNPKSIYPSQGIVEAIGRSTDSVDKTKVDSTRPEVVYVNDRFFVWNGHLQVSRAIKENQNFVDVEIVAVNDELVYKGLSADEFVRTSVSLSWVYDWEEGHKFSFHSYPENLETQRKKDIH